MRKIHKKLSRKILHQPHSHGFFLKRTLGRVFCPRHSIDVRIIVRTTNSCKLLFLSSHSIGTTKNNYGNSIPIACSKASTIFRQNVLHFPAKDISCNHHSNQPWFPLLNLLCSAFYHWRVLHRWPTLSLRHAVLLFRRRLRFRYVVWKISNGAFRSYVHSVEYKVWTAFHHFFSLFQNSCQLIMANHNYTRTGCRKWGFFWWPRRIGHPHWNYPHKMEWWARHKLGWWLPQGPKGMQCQGRKYLRN